MVCMYVCMFACMYIADPSVYVCHSRSPSLTVCLHIFSMYGVCMRYVCMLLYVILIIKNIYICMYM